MRYLDSWEGLTMLSDMWNASEKRKKKIKKLDLTEDEVRHECYRLGLGVVGNSDVFGWMQSWLKAYDKEHKTNLAEEILEWVNNQPMSC